MVVFICVRVILGGGGGVAGVGVILVVIVAVAVVVVVVFVAVVVVVVVIVVIGVAVVAVRVIVRVVVVVVCCYRICSRRPFARPARLCSVRARSAPACIHPFCVIIRTHIRPVEHWCSRLHIIPRLYLIFQQYFV